MAAAFAISLQFDPPKKSPTIHLFAPLGTSCSTWKRVIPEVEHSLPVRLIPCVPGSPPAQLQNFVSPGDGVAVLNPELPAPGGSGEYRAGNNRWYVIEINPRIFNRYTWRHEVGGHLLQGHSAVTVSFLPDPAVNALLDLCFVDPYLLFGDRWRTWMTGIIAFILCAAYSSFYPEWSLVTLSRNAVGKLRLLVLLRRWKSSLQRML